MRRTRQRGTIAPARSRRTTSPESASGAHPAPTATIVLADTPPTRRHLLHTLIKFFAVNVSMMLPLTSPHQATTPWRRGFAQAREVVTVLLSTPIFCSRAMTTFRRLVVVSRTRRYETLRRHEVHERRRWLRQNFAAYAWTRSTSRRPGKRTVTRSCAGARTNIFNANVFRDSIASPERWKNTSTIWRKRSYKRVSRQTSSGRLSEIRWVRSTTKSAGGGGGGGGRGGDPEDAIVCQLAPCYSGTFRGAGDGRYQGVLRERWKDASARKASRWGKNNGTRCAATGTPSTRHAMTCERCRHVMNERRRGEEVEEMSPRRRRGN